MGLDDHPTNGKPYAGPGGLCRKKRFEDTVLVLTPQSRTGVFHGNHNIGGLLDDIGAHLQVAGTIGHGAHCFDRVRNQIQKYLLQLASIARQLEDAVA